jgi:hypothetical protein
MSDAQNKYRFLLIQAFSLPPGARYRMRQMQGSKESMLMNLGVDASGLAFPIDHPKKWRRKKLF